jgi:mono/diheme cytochrome c family protein
MSSSNSKPDLDDSINVTEAHGRLVREAAAAVRENRIADNGVEPITLWVLAACGVVLLVAGGILNVHGNLFSYNSTFPEGYQRKPVPGTENSGPETKEALAAYMDKGKKIYTSKCNGCHGAGAQGDGANFPSLVGSAWALGETERFSMIILNGLQGPTSTGKDFPGGGMPSQAAGMSPEDLAGIMTYVRNNFGNTKGDIVTVEMAKAAMEISAARAKAGLQVTGAELTSDHVKNLSGQAIDPKTPVDPKTLLPVAPATTK